MRNMKVILQLEMDERDYIMILQVAGIKNITTEDLIKQAIREYINKEMQSLQPTTQPTTKNESKK